MLPTRMEVAIDEAWHAGQAAWPGVSVVRERFADFVRERGIEAARRFPGDLYLAAACLTGDATALRTFERDVLVAARPAIQAIDSAPAFVDEVFQRVRELLFVGNGQPRLTQYAGRGPLQAWVGVAAARTAITMMREQGRAREVALEGDAWPAALAANNPELQLLSRQYADAFTAALRDSVAALEPRLRAVLRRSYVDALSIDEIGELYGVHRATAARWIQRACETVFEHSRQLLAERLSLSATELDRMTAMVRSQLEVSLSQLLPETNG